MADDIWAEARDRAERAEHKPGMTPYRRGVARLFVEPLTDTIAAKLADKAHLPHGRLGKLLQAAEPRALALMAIDAVVPQIGRRFRRSPEMRLRESIGQTFYANVELGTKTYRQSKLMLRGNLAIGRYETLKSWQARLQRTRSVIWQTLIREASRHECVNAGAWLLNRVVEADIIVVVNKQILPTDKYREPIKHLQGLLVRANVRLHPLRDGPLPWTAPEKWHSGKKVPLLPHWNPAFQDKIAESFQSERFRRQHLAALNTAADVALCIDPWTLDLVRDYAGKVKKYPDDDRRAADESQIARDLKTAELLARRDQFKNGYHIDFRGRFQADESFNYQQQDRVRSLIRFAHGAHLGLKGLRWLKIHAANTYGQDKLSYAKRIKWAEQHRNRIAQVAADPNGAAALKFWRGADKPFAFAAACRELTRAWADPGFITNLPLAFDHSASGLQHLTLLGLDEKAAPLVNLVDCDAPRDIYGKLAAHTLELFDDSPQAEFWREKLRGSNARKLLKQPGMTFSYAATSRGNIRQVYEAYEDAFPEEEKPPFTYMVYLVERFRRACAEMLPGPVRIMEYIQSQVAECNKRRRFLEWTGQTGLLVPNLYPKVNKTTVYTLGGEYTVADGAIPNSIDKRQTKSSAAANFVHCHDAAHLARTINELAANHMPVLPVHDAFAVLAPHAEQFHITNREELALMYDEIFRNGGPFAQWRNIPGEPPPTGSFNYWQVQQATYACS